ncbi:c-type cytochrome [Thiocystis violacea]|uniref:c-type cytochrome n=1 Tax=Thiocystis violacea TaxID=13725 RepID=UPI0019038531|nr:c-type cytochrome [Thiocystis violacea]MBK1717625.1 cytochrome C [Thiocystis violacea]
MPFNTKALRMILLIGLATAAQADDSTQPPVGSGNPVPDLAICAGCHQANGGGVEALGAPRLAAMGASYLAQQIANFKDGHRQHSLMTPWAKLLTEAEIRAMSEHFAALPPASNAEPPADVDPEIGRRLALYGDWPGRRLPACGQCHGPLGIGVGEHFPALAGQPYSYLVGQLTAWTSGERGGDPLGMMGAINARLSVAETRSVAAFYASLPAARSVDLAGRINRGEIQPEAATTPTPGPNAAPAPHPGQVTSGRAPGPSGHFTPPARDDKPSDAFGEMVALGEAIFTHTDSHAISGQYVGNRQVCEDCHLDAGRLADAAPMWAAWVAYPAYRAKDNRVSTIIERIQGCFTYSMNAQASEVGHPPTAESQTIHALASYLYWLATGAPTGDRTMPGRGYPKLAETELGFDPDRGAAVYERACAICHGADGEGGQAGDQRVFPPLWGASSYNWGAGMHNIDTAAAFIKTNMPLGNFLELSDQEAWDVAAFINAQERPRDPRFTGDLAETTARFHDSRFDYHGKRAGPDGQPLGASEPKPAR